MAISIKRPLTLLPTIRILTRAGVDFLRKFFLSPIWRLRLKTFYAFGTNGKMSEAKPSRWHIGTSRAKATALILHRKRDECGY